MKDVPVLESRILRFAQNDRLAHSPRRLLLSVALALLCLASLLRFALTPFGYGIPAWFEEELGPLIRLLTRGEPIQAIDPRQYGVVVFLVFDPAVRALGDDPSALASYALVVAGLMSVIGFALMAVRFGQRDVVRVLVLAGLWFSAVPLLYVVAQRMVDAWQLAFVSATFFLFVSASPRLRMLAGVPLAAATLTKLLPAFLLGYLFVRNWRIALLGVGCIVALLGIGHLLYGPLMGFGYPLAVLGSGESTVARWSTHFENNSIRGLIYKVAAGFRLEGDTTAYVLAESWLPTLNILAWLASGLLVIFLVFAAWRGRHHDTPQRRAVELSLAVVTMLLVSPHTAQDYTVVMLPVLAACVWLWSERQPAAWSRGLTALGIAAAALICVFIPMNIVMQVIPFDALLIATGNARNAVFSNQIGLGIGAYDFFGLPGLGLVLAWGLLARLEHLTACYPARAS